MDLKQLEYLVCVVESGSFSRAAVALNLAQPSVSRQIALLEEELGQRLLTRTGRGVTATEAGEALLVHARTMLASSRAARDELRDMGDSPSGRIVIGMPPRVALGISVPLVRRFRERFPRAVITILEGLSIPLRESLMAGRLDLALLFDPPATPQLSYTQLSRERLLLIAPPGHRLPKSVGLSSLADYPLILPSAPNAIRNLVDAALRPQGVQLKVHAEVGAVNTVLALVAHGQGCTILPESAVALGLQGPPLPRTPIGPPEIWNTLMLAVPKAKPANRLIRETSKLLTELDFRG